MPHTYTFYMNRLNGETRDEQEQRIAKMLNNYPAWLDHMVNDGDSNIGWYGSDPKPEPTYYSWRFREIFSQVPVERITKKLGVRVRPEGEGDY